MDALWICKLFDFLLRDSLRLNDSDIESVMWGEKDETATNCDEISMRIQVQITALSIIFDDLIRSNIGQDH